MALASGVHSVQTLQFPLLLLLLSGNSLIGHRGLVFLGMPELLGIAASFSSSLFLLYSAGGV